MKKLLHLTIGSRATLARRFVLLIFLCGAFAFSLSTALEFYQGYIRGEETINDNLEFIEQSYLEPLTLSLYNLDKVQLQLLLKGLLKLKGVSGCRIEELHENAIAITEGDNSNLNSRTHSYDLTYRHPAGIDIHLGRLILFINTSEITRELWNWLSIRLVTVFPVLCLLMFLVMVLFQRVIARHLGQVADFAEQIDLTNINFRFKLDRPSREDELEKVVKAINELLDRLELGIAEQEKAKQALHKSEDAYRNLIENANDAIYIEQNGVMKFCNPVTEQITGYTSEELFALPFLNLIHADDRERVLKKQTDNLSNKRHPATYSFRIVRKDKQVVWVQINGVTVEWDNQPATLSFLRDITEQRSLEEQLVQSQKMDSIGRLAGGVAHDLNNLLTPILGYGELLKQGNLNPERHKNGIDQIIAAGTRARDLVRQLLAFSRKQTMEYKPIDINSVVDGLQKLFQRTIRENIAININREPDLPSVKADIGQVEQVLMNLIVNASDAMPNGGKVIIETRQTLIDEHYIDTHLDVKPGGYIQLSVSDTGVGMDKETCSKIYEPFFTTKGKYGTGLGLSTVYGIIKQHNGFINVYSEPGKGTTFTVFLPITSEQQDYAPDSPETSTQVHGSETVLLVEDNEQVREITEDMLKSLGYTVMVAKSGEEALHLYSTYNDQIHLLLTDVIMPNMNGRELYSEIARTDPALKVIYMSGYTSDVIGHHGVLEDGIHYLQKPFSTLDLATKIRTVLGSRTHRER